MTSFEQRVAVAPITGVQFRDASSTPDGTWTISGYAAVYGQETTLYDGTYLRLREIIVPGAFDEVLRNSPIVHLNLGHDMNRCVAATDVATGEPGGLTLRSDDQGLYFMARVDRADPDSQALCTKLARGVIKQASFAFTVAPSGQRVTETTDPDGKVDELREITQIKDLYDVCCTPQGAYPQTSSMVRSVWGAQFGQPSTAGGHPHQPLLERGAIVVSEELSGDEESRKRLAALKAKALTVRLSFPLLTGEK